VTNQVGHVRSVQVRSGQARSRQGQVKSDKVMSAQIKIRSRSDQVSSRSCQCQIKDMPMSGQVMVGQYNVRSMSVQGQVTSK